MIHYGMTTLYVLLACMVLVIFLYTRPMKEGFRTLGGSKKKKNKMTTKTKTKTTQPRAIIEPSLDTPNSEPQPLPPTFAQGPCTQEMREPESEAETELLKTLVEKMTEFTTHLSTKYPDHPMAKRALETWNGDVKMSTRATGATFFRNTGCMIVNPYYENVKRVGRVGDPMDPIERILTRILHELAHSWFGGHTAAFYDAQRWFLRVATEDLGWNLAVTCRVCCGYTGATCSQETVCPKCTWTETDCAVNGKNCNTPDASGTKGRLSKTPKGLKCTVVSGAVTRIGCAPNGWAIRSADECMQTNCNHRSSTSKPLDRFKTKRECDAMRQKCVASGRL